MTKGLSRALWAPVLLLSATFLLPGGAPAQMSGAPSQAQAPDSWNFYFGGGTLPAGYTRAMPGEAYSAQRGYGFEPWGKPPVSAAAGTSAGLPQAPHGVCSDGPFFFSVAAPEGNYDVSITLGSSGESSVSTVKAEARRLLIAGIATPAGEFAAREFTLNIRTPQISWGGQVALKARDEIGSLDWDNKLTLEFNNRHPCVAALQVVPAPSAVTVYIAGDSTVTDQPAEPWAAWGQMLPAFFKPGVAIANQAESGESLKSFINEHRLDKILSLLKPGDYLFIQFAHNDQKSGPRYARTYVQAETTYKAYLNVFVQEARLRGATPVLVTSMNRRSFGPDGKIQNTLEGYPAAMREYAREANVPLIDLNAMSKMLYEALGPGGTLKAFVHYPAGTFPGQTTELKDDTHFNAYGAYELARCVVEGIRENRLPLEKFLREDQPFDPAHPDPVAEFALPASPFIARQAPAGN